MYSHLSEDHSATPHVLVVDQKVSVLALLLAGSSKPLSKAVQCHVVPGEVSRHGEVAVGGVQLHVDLRHSLYCRKMGSKLSLKRNKQKLRPSAWPACWSGPRCRCGSSAWPWIEPWLGCSLTRQPLTVLGSVAALLAHSFIPSPYLALSHKKLRRALRSITKCKSKIVL